MIVPVGDLVLVFEPAKTGSDPTSPTGMSVVSTTLSRIKVPPTLLQFERSGSSWVARAEQRESKTNPLVSAARPTIELALDAGKVRLSASSGGVFSISGPTAAIDALVSLDKVTVLSASAGILRVYPGAPKAVLGLAAGSCSRPFTFEPTGEDRIRISPPDACTGEIWLTPVASPTPAAVGNDYLRSGAAAIGGSKLRATTLAPVRNGVIWRAWGTGTLTREAAPSGYGAKAAASIAAKHATVTPMLSLPVGSTSQDFYVFHHATALDLFPNDVPWGPLDEPPANELPGDDTCDPSIPGQARRGVGPTAPGPRPVKATVVNDLHGTLWTLYADERGLMIRSVNHATGALWSFQHDPGGNLIGVEAPDLARQCFRYDPDGNLWEALSLPAWGNGLPVADPIRQRVDYQSGPTRVRAVRDPRDVTRVLARFEYDADGNLTRSIDADGHETVFTPVGGDGPERAMPLEIRDPSGAVTRLGWDVSTGTLQTTVVDATSDTPVSVEHVADEAGRTVWARSPLGVITTAAFDGPFLQGSTFDADGRVGYSTVSYDDDGKIESVVRGVRQTLVEYNVIGSVVSTTELAHDGSAAPIIRCQKAAPGGRVLEAVSGEGHRTRYTYDGEGRVIAIEAGDLGASAEAWDDACPARPPGPSAAGTIATFEYDTSGRLVAMTDARGLTHSIKVDGHGRPVIATAPDGTSTRRGYDALGNVLWEAVYGPGTTVSYRPPVFGDDRLLSAAEQVFDHAGRLVERRVWHLSHNGAAIGDGVQTTRFDQDVVARTVTVTDDLGRATTTRFDGAGRPVETRLPDGSEISTSYLDGGRTIYETGPVNGTVQTRFAKLTAWGAIATVAIVAGTANIAVAQVTHDEWLRPQTTTTATGFTSTTTYDAFDRPRTVTGAPGETVVLHYDRDHRLTTRTSDAGPGSPTASWSFEVDALGRPWRTIDPEGAKTDTVYGDLSGLPSAVVDPRGSRFTYTYSAQGLPVAVLADGKTAPDVRLGFGYDALGRMTSATRDDYADGSTDSTAWFTWDSLGNLATERDSVVNVLREHDHDAMGRRYGSRLGAHSVKRRFDALDRLTEVKVGNESPVTATFQYPLGPGGPHTRSLKNGLRTRYGYDTLGRLDALTDVVAATNALVASSTWELPLDGVPRTHTFERPGASAVTRVFDVDPAGRLIAEQGGFAASPVTLAPTGSYADASAAVNAVFTPALVTDYDLTGRHSWRSRTTGGVTTSYTLDAADAVTAIGAAPIEYDVAGALVDDGTSTFEYDVFGQLSYVDSPAGTRKYQRDALGRIVMAAENNTPTYYAYDGLRRAFRKAPTGEVDATIGGAGLDDHLVTLLASGQRHYYHQDRLGSVYLVSGDAGAPLEWLRYTAYGEPTITSPTGQALTASAIGNRFGFQGHPHDWATGLVDMRARHYRPTWGRFLSMDPIGLAGGVNPYAFVSASPLSFIDPLGLSKEGAKGLNTSQRPFQVYPDWFIAEQRKWQELRQLRPTYNDRVAARVLGGTLSAIGGALAFPVCQACGYAGIAWGADQVSTGVRERFSGEHEDSLYRMALGGVAGSLGIDPKWADFGEIATGVVIDFTNAAVVLGGLNNRLATIDQPSGAAGFTDDAQSLPSTAEPPKQYIYRGVSANHPKLDEAKRGVVTPGNINGNATPEQHNAGGAQLDSPYTSWTHDYAEAVKHATKDGPGGVILKAPVGAPPPGASWSWEWSPDIWMEKEVLLRGVRDGLEVLFDF